MNLPSKFLTGLATLTAGYLMKKSADSAILNIKIVDVTQHSNNLVCVYKNFFGKTKRAYSIGNQWFDSDTDALLPNHLSKRIASMSTAFLRTNNKSTLLLTDNKKWE